MVEMHEIEIVLQVEIPIDMSQKDKDALLLHILAGDLAITSGIDYCILDGRIEDQYED